MKNKILQNVHFVKRNVENTGVLPGFRGENLGLEFGIFNIFHVRQQLFSLSKIGGFVK